MTTTQSNTTKSKTEMSSTKKPSTTSSVSKTTASVTKNEIDRSEIIDISEELSDEDIKLNFIIDKTKIFSSSLRKVYINNIDISDSFEKLKKLETDKKIEILWNYLLSNFKNNYNYMTDNFSKIKKKNMKLSENKNKINKIKKEIKILKEKISTKEKLYKINFNRYNEMIFETNILRNFMIYLMILLIIPILRLANIINKTIGVVSYSGLLAIGIIYSVYLFFEDKSQRDNVFYNRLNFEKPEKEEKPEKNES